MTDTLAISAVLYQQERLWIAQGLEHDIAAQAESLPAVCNRFVAKVAAELAISLELGRAPLAGIGAAPEKFWRMYEAAQIALDLKVAAVRIEGTDMPRISPRLKVAELDAAA